jgi:predicted Zn-dependent protease
MTPDMLDNLQSMLEAGKDSPMLRFTLGDLYLKRGDAQSAATHLAEAVRQDESYSAAWKLYGKALMKAERMGEARQVYGRGIEVAEAGGDKQAAKEMRVFLKRLNKTET